MANANELQATANAENVLMIDLATRSIIIPETVTSLGVESDEDVQRLPFKIPRHFCGIDLAEFVFRINYENANGIGDVYTVDDMVAEEEYITFSWLVGRMAAIIKGDVSFNVCLKKTDSTGWVIKEFNTRPSTLPVWEGLETSQAVVQQNPDVLEEILLRLSAAEAGVNNALYGQPKELTESWAELRNRIRAGDFAGINVGDYKTITLAGGEPVVMEVAGIDTYCNSGPYYGRVEHHIDFISRDCLETPMQYNETDTNNGNAAYYAPYKSSDLYKKILNSLDSIYNSLPKDLRECLVDKWAVIEQRYSSTEQLAANSGECEDCLGQLWLPFELEVFGRHDHSDARYGSGAGCNMQYPIFKDSTKHLVKGAGKGGEQTSWWMASAYANSKFSFLGVSSAGQSGIYTATSRLNIPLCFRIA